MLGSQSYAPIALQEQDGAAGDATANTPSVACLQADMAAPLKRPLPTYQEQFPVTRNLTWMDSYYDGKHGIVAAFDRDTYLAGKALAFGFLKSSFFFVMISVLYWILGALDYNLEESIMDDILGVYTFGFALLFVAIAWRSNLAMQSQHVALTTEGIRIDNGSMMTVTVPYEFISKIEVKPFQATCFSAAMSLVSPHHANSTLNVIKVERAAAPLEQIFCQKTKNMELYGIIRAQEFVQLVQAMQASQTEGTYHADSIIFGRTDGGATPMDGDTELPTIQVVPSEATPTRPAAIIQSV